MGNDPNLYPNEEPLPDGPLMSAEAEAAITQAIHRAATREFTPEQQMQFRAELWRRMHGAA